MEKAKPGAMKSEPRYNVTTVAATITATIATIRKTLFQILLECFHEQQYPPDCFY